MPPPDAPFLNNRFLVEIDGLVVGDFAEVILPEAFAEVVEYRNGSDKDKARKLPGTIGYGALILQRGVTASNDLFSWWNNIANGVPDRRNVAVTLLDDARSPVKRWLIFGVWPSRYAVAPLYAADEAVVLMETLECASDGMTVE